MVTLLGAWRLVAPILVIGSTVLCESNVVSLDNVSEFLEFVDDVNSGMSYKGTTVFLDADIDISGHVEAINPIGKSEESGFAGVFDGQGYIVNGFVVNTTSRYAGLFGYTEGATIKNTLLNSKSVIAIVGDGTDSPEDIMRAGSIVGYCEDGDGHCNIENSINLAEVTYRGSARGKVCLGGIAGYVSSEHGSHIRNCANYGTVASYGECKTIGIGGIIGRYSGGSVTLTASNCLNNGEIHFERKNADLCYVGGIVGHSEHCSFDNCVSDGMIISMSGTKSETTGSLCGVSSYTTFKNCYWNEDTGGLALWTTTEECTSYDSFYVLNKIVNVANYTGYRLLDVLNIAVTYYSLYDYSRWGYSTKKYQVNFTIDKRTRSFLPDTQLFLLPGLSSDGLLAFDGWYTDKDCTSPLTTFVFKSNDDVYGRWSENTNEYTIFLDTRGGSAETTSIKGRFNTAVTLPKNVTKGECTFGWWENDYGDKIDSEFTIPAHSATLHAVWGCTEIKSASDLVGLAKIVNSGTSHGIASVSLANDIEFTDEESRQFEPIGKSKYTPFRGLFDGRGYTIKNLKLKTYSGNAGVFGYSEGVTIRSLVMDSACAVASTYGSASFGDEESHYGALVGYCVTLNGNCALENNVNMGSVTFNGDTSTNIFIGGLAGYFMTTGNHRSNVVNCANYGAVAHAGKTGTYVDIGGLLGGCNGGGDGALIANCMNYGEIHNEGGFNSPSIGGFVGYSVEKASYENCVNFGRIRSKEFQEGIGFAGAFVGEFYSGCVIKNCYWDEKAYDGPIGNKDDTSRVEGLVGFDDEEFELNETVYVGEYAGKSLVGALNAYSDASLNSIYSRWILNRNMDTVTFAVANRTSPLIVLESKVILMPNITGIQEKYFFGWFVDSGYSKYFVASEITRDTTLYGFINKTYVPPEIESSQTIVQTTITVCVLSLIVIVVLIVVAFVLWSKVNNKLRARREVHELMEPILFDRPANSIDFLGLYTDDYKQPTMKDALINAGIESTLAEKISSMCYSHANKLKEAKKLPRGVTVDDAAAIALYTMETDTLEQKPYKMVNEALMNGEFTVLEPVKDLLYLVMCALRKMPVVYNKLFYRGISSHVLDENAEADSDDLTSSGSSSSTDLRHSAGRTPTTTTTTTTVTRKRQAPVEQSLFSRGEGSFDGDYLEGEEVSWSALSSTSPDVTVTKVFLAKGTVSKKAEGTLFIIENGWGYNVQSCSMFPDEEEIVLEPERRFRVKTVIPGEGLTVIKMEMLRTPLVLIDVFGEARGRPSKTSSEIARVDKDGGRFGFLRRIGRKKRN